MTAFVLLHSPLVGPTTWTAVGDVLQMKEVQVVLPKLTTQPGDQPYWEQHSQAVLQSLEGIPAGSEIVLAGHSGAGVLLPAVGEGLPGRASAYIFVDADLPEHGKSRFDLFDDARSAEAVRRSSVNGFIPVWQEADLMDEIENPELRKAIVGELQPLPLAVYEEPIPVFAGWPDAPCGYLQFTAAYQKSAEIASKKGWGFQRLEGRHFHMLNHPQRVAEALISMAAQLGVS